MPTISINRLVKKNKFGFNTYYVELDDLHRIEINETTNGTYILEFKELGIIWNTTIYSFTSSRDIVDAISEAMDKVNDYYRNSPKYEVSEHVLASDKMKVMQRAYNLFKS